jgi:peroxin-1
LPESLKLVLSLTRAVVAPFTVLHKLLRYELNVSPLFDSVRIESEAAFDSSEAVEMVSCGSLALSLERVNFILTDHDSLWRAPEEVPPRPLWLDSSKERTPYSVQLHSIMASWLDDLDITKHVPLRSGSLFAVSEKKSQGDHPNEQIYRLVTHLMSVDQEHADTESVYVAAKDLPHLLLKSCSVVSQLTPVDFNNEQKGLSLSKQELSLNLLPPISDITIDESINASNLCGDIACFDSIILIGDLGSGKTHAALMLGARARVIKEYGTLYLDCKRLQSSCDVRMKDILQALTDIFNEAIQAVRSCVIILDDIDKLIPNVTMGGEEDGSAHQQQPNPVAIDQAKLLADHLNRLIEDACTESKKEKPFVMMTARDDQSIHPTIATRFHRTVNVPSFTGRDREELFATMLRNSMGKGTLIRIGTADLHDFGKRTEGFRPRDLAVVATRVSLILDGSESHDLNLMEAVNSRLKGYVPISLQGVRAHDTTCSVAWSQIGGLFGAKEYLSSSILRPVKYRRIYQHSPIRLPRGIVLYGPPGCGKSFLVPALAKECGLTLVTCRGPELLDKYIGASEAKVRQLFHRAYAASPSLLFLDEFDALAPVRGSDHTGVTDRVVNQLLTYLDGVEDAAIGAVYIIAATSRPDKVDPALLRPGRLEQHVYVGFPTSIEEWHSISEQSLSGHSIDSHLQDVIEKRKLLEAPCLAHALSFSPADIKAVVDTAYLNAVHEFLASSDEVMEGSQNEPVVIEMHHMVNALQTTRPSLSINDRRMLEQAYRPFMSATDRPEDEHDTESTGQKRLKTALK